MGAALDREAGIDVVLRVESGDDLAGVLDQTAAVDVVLDLTTAVAVRQNLPLVAERRIAAVIGATGLNDADLAHADHLFRAAERPCFLVPNFSIGAVLMMRFAEQAAPWFEGVEIIELHHPAKLDAPSGTARLTAHRVADARAQVSEDETEDALPGARGAEVEGVHVHSVRLPGLLAHQEVVFGSTGQTLTLRHDSYDRSSFVSGVLLALKSVTNLPPGVTTGLDAVL